MPLLLIYGSDEELQSGRGVVVVPAAQAALMLNVSDRRFRQLVARGDISPAARIVTADLYLVSDVKALHERRSTGEITQP